MNFGNILEEDLNFASSHSDIPNSAELVVITKEDALENGREVGNDINLRNVNLAAGEAAVFVWPYSR